MVPAGEWPSYSYKAPNGTLKRHAKIRKLSPVPPGPAGGGGRAGNDLSAARDTATAAVLKVQSQA